MLNSKRITALLTALAAAASLVSMQSMSVFAEEANEEEIDYSTYKPEGDADTSDWVEVIDEDGEVTDYDPAYLKFATRFGDVNADRNVTVMELFRYIYKDVLLHSDKKQHPQLVAPKTLHDTVLMKW